MTDQLEDDVRAITAISAALKPLDDDARLRVLEFVLKKYDIGLSLPATAAAQNDQSSLTPDSAAAATARSIPSLQPQAAAAATSDIRSFASEKNPKTVNGKLAVVAFYLAHLAPENERRESISADDIKPLFIQAGFALPEAPPRVTLTNAKNAGYFDAAARGQYRLNAVGYNLVAHKLPSEEARSSAGTKKSKPRKKRSRRARKPESERSRSRLGDADGNLQFGPSRVR
jgi:hypothetical protein